MADDLSLLPLKVSSKKLRLRLLRAIIKWACFDCCLVHFYSVVEDFNFHEGSVNFYNTLIFLLHFSFCKLEFYFDTTLS